jgi:hypothetical protein
VTRFLFNLSGESFIICVCVLRASYVVATEERIREHPAHPLPFASCRFSFQIVPFFLTGAVVFFRRDESHMAGRKRNRSIYDLRILLVSCCYFLFESLSFAAKKTSSNFTPASIFVPLSRSIMRGSSSTRNKGRKNKGASILIELYRVYIPFFLCWLPVCGNSTSEQKCVLLFWKIPCSAPTRWI